MQFISINNIESVSVDSPRGKALIKERAKEAKALQEQKDIEAEISYFDTLKEQLKVAEQVVIDIKASLN